MKIKIKHRYTSAVLYMAEAPISVPPELGASHAAVG